MAELWMILVRDVFNISIHLQIHKHSLLIFIIYRCGRVLSCCVFIVVARFRGSFVDPFAKTEFESRLWYIEYV